MGKDESEVYLPVHFYIDGEVTPFIVEKLVKSCATLSEYGSIVW